MSEQPHAEDPANPPRPRGPWQRPALTPLGHVKDLILGGPKTGGADDPDFGSRKNPNG